MIAETTREKALIAAANGRQAFVLCQNGKYPETINLTRLLEKVLTEKNNIFFADIDMPPQKIVNEASTATSQSDKVPKTVSRGYHGGRPSELDDNKIMALRNAGWSYARIAEEMGVEIATIKYHLRKLREAG